MVKSRTTLTVLIVVLVLLGASAAFIGFGRGRTGRTRGHHVEVPSAAGPMLPAAHFGRVNGPVPPAKGAWLGAYAQWAALGMTPQAAEANRLEVSITRRLRIIHEYSRWLAPFPNALDRAVIRSGHVLLLSWAGTNTRSIIAGRYDALIRTRARALKALRAPLLLEWRWEMNRPNLHQQVHSPADYIAAWRHIHRLFDQMGARNVGWVWCPAGSGSSVGPAEAYYPGNRFVDWLCVDVYPGFSYDSLPAMLRPFLIWAKDHPKPVMVGEFGVPAGAQGEQGTWLSQLLTAARRMPSVKAYVYFDAVGPRRGSPTDVVLSRFSLRVLSNLMDLRFFGGNTTS
ncbi:MAG: glycoside hydrolase family 26 protein [Acidimicrobiales bacterium]